MPIATNEADLQLAALVESLPGAVFRCREDEHWSLIWVSAGCLQFTGFSREELLGGSVPGLASLVASEDRLRVAAECELTRGETTSHTHEYRLIQKDGTAIWASASCQRRYAADGSVMWLEGFLQDITARKEAELRSAEREAQFRALAEYIPDPVFVVDPSDGEVPLRILYVTPAVQRTHGYAPEELIGKSLTEMLDAPSSAAEAPNRAARIMAGETVGFEVVHRHRDGHLIPMEVRAGLIPWGGRQALVGINRDMTKQRHAEAEAIMSEDRWKLAIECAGGAIWEWLPESQTLLLSDRWKAMLGYGDDEIGTGIEEWTDRAHPDDLGRAVAAFQDHIAGTTPSYVCDHRLRHKDGSWIWVHDCGNVVEWDASGKPTRVIGLKTDITAYKQAQDQIRHLSERLALAVRGAGYGIWEFDLDNKVLIWDDAMHALYGLEVGQFQGNVEIWRGTIHEDDRGLVDRRFADLVAGGQVSDFLFRIRRATDGALRIVEANGFLQRDSNGAPQRLVGMNRDATEQHTAAMALRESEHRFRSYVENANDVIVSVQPDGRVSYVSPNWLRQMGEPSASAIGRHAAEYVHPEDAQSVRGFLAAVREGNEAGTAIQYRARHADGTWRSHTTTVSILRAPDGTFQSFLGIARDMTDYLSLQSRVGQAEKLQVVGRLAGGVAHDFNNMLTLILAHADLALEVLPLDSPVVTDLEKIRDAATRSAGLTRQLLAFARQQQVSPQALDLNARINGMIQMFHRVLGQNIRFDWSPAADLWPVLMDPAQVDQIISNLIVNSRDAIQGEGVITITTSNFVAEELYPAGSGPPASEDFVLLKVADNGVGMTADVLKHIFEPFFSTKEPTRGTGLGLATVYGSITQSGGCIDVQSSPGEGTTFLIYLPRATGAINACEAEPPKGQIRGAETILFVEDEPSILEFGMRVLSSQGYHVIAASEPEQALEIAKDSALPIHLLLTDVMMPVMTGRELSEALQRTRPGLRVLYISGYTAQEFGPEAAEDPLFHFLQKPFGVEALRTKVREVLEQVR